MGSVALLSVAEDVGIPKERTARDIFGTSILKSPGKVIVRSLSAAVCFVSNVVVWRRTTFSRSRSLS